MKRKLKKPVSLAHPTPAVHNRQATDLLRGRRPFVLDSGALSVSDVERRIMRACKTLRALPDPDRKFQWIGTCWPEVVRSTEEAYGYEEATVRMFRPSPADVSDLLVALGWVRGMPWDEYRLIWWRSFDVSFRQIGLRIHRSDETARAWYRDALLRIWHEANAQKYAERKRAS